MERDFKTHIGYHVQEIARRLTWVHDERLKDYGITFSQFRVLNCLWEEDGLNQTEILSYLRMKPSSLSALIVLLVRKKLILRVEDEQDHRSRRIYLTGEGKKLKWISWDIILDLENSLSEGFDDKKKDSFLSDLKQVCQNIEEKEKRLKSNVN